MDRQGIIKYLREEMDILRKALEALEDTITTRRGRATGNRRGRATNTRRTHRLTPEGRRKLSMMMKKRWAERRKKMKAA